MTGWFLFDVLATVPFDMLVPNETFENTNTQLAKGFKVFRIIRFMKMLRLVKIFWLTKKINETESGKQI